MDPLSVKDVCHELAATFGVTVTPHELSNLIYRRHIPADVAPMTGGRRLIARAHLPAVAAVVRARRPKTPAAAPPTDATCPP